ncbi:hydrolase [Domibacillus mangrovi]|uniref:Hydrolase n=1 Tax=Domibacillus mangrovi TaxID=1714354 RepID=A0A1Q5P212_9BACI|nr:hydrolase [Domibacillus mangrovi]OKL36182.1 hydrolase [Domibacillus mangrovi]
MEKQAYYIQVANGEIQSRSDVSPWEFRIFANEKEIQDLRGLFTEMNEADSRTFWRTHLPAVPYHMDKDNDQYDKRMMEVYDKLYELGDEDTRSHIKKMRNEV